MTRNPIGFHGRILLRSIVHFEYMRLHELAFTPARGLDELRSGGQTFLIDRRVEEM